MPVSKETASAWEKWRIAHPNWKPNPNLHRPKYVMNREEAVDKVQFSCAVDLVPADAEIHFVPANLDVPPPVIDLHPMDTTQISFPELTPPEVGEPSQALSVDQPAWVSMLCCWCRTASTPGEKVVPWTATWP